MASVGVASISSGDVASLTTIINGLTCDGIPLVPSVSLLSLPLLTVCFAFAEPGRNKGVHLEGRAQVHAASHPTLPHHPVPTRLPRLFELCLCMYSQYVECDVGEYRVSNTSCVPCPAGSFDGDKSGTYVFFRACSLGSP